MPKPPTEDQYNAAVQNVLASAPPGLSEGQFDALISHEIERGAFKSYRPTAGNITENPANDPENSFTGKLVRVMQQAAHPQTISDMAPYLLPSSIGLATSGLTKIGLQRIKSAIQTMRENAGSNLQTIGKAAEDFNVMKPAQIPGKMATWLGNKLSPPEAAPNPAFEKLGLDPNATGNVLDTYPSRHAPARGGFNTPPPVSQPKPRVDPSVYESLGISPDATGNVMDSLPDTPATRARVSEPPPRRGGIDTSNTTVPPKLVKSPPTLDDVLEQALQDARQPEKPSVVSGPPEPTTAAGGTHTGKVRKGQGKGFDSGNPSTRPAPPDDVPALDYTNPDAGEPAPWKPEWAGPQETPAKPEAEGPFSSTENPEWHSGAEPGSPEARQAQSSHKFEQEMDAGYKRRVEGTQIDPELLQELLRQLGHQE